MSESLLGFLACLLCFYYCTSRSTEVGRDGGFYDLCRVLTKYLGKKLNPPAQKKGDTEDIETPNQ